MPVSMLSVTGPPSGPVASALKSQTYPAASTNGSLFRASLICFVPRA